MGIPSIPLGISSGENGVNQNKRSNDLSTQANAGAVAVAEGIGTTTIPVVVRPLESLHQTNTTDSTQALSHHVHDGPDQRHLSSQKQPKCHCWVYVSSCVEEL